MTEAIWFGGYVRTYLERDLRALSSISALPDFRRLMRAACLGMGQLVNQTDLGRDVALPQPTVHRYLNLLETSYLLGAPARLRRQSHQAPDKVTETVLGRHGRGDALGAGD